MNRRAVVFGAAGQLGVELVRRTAGRGYEVSGWDRSEVDITDAGRVETALAALRGRGGRSTPPPTTRWTWPRRSRRPLSW